MILYNYFMNIARGKCFERYHMYVYIMYICFDIQPFSYLVEVCVREVVTEEGRCLVFPPTIRYVYKHSSFLLICLVAKLG